MRRRLHALCDTTMGAWCTTGGASHRNQGTDTANRQRHTSRIKPDTVSSHTGSGVSSSTSTMSKRDSSGLAMDVFTDKSADGSYLPCCRTRQLPCRRHVATEREQDTTTTTASLTGTLGLQDAITVARAFSLHTKPALATLSVCCSIAVSPPPIEQTSSTKTHRPPFQKAVPAASSVRGVRG